MCNESGHGVPVEEREKGEMESQLIVRGQFSAQAQFPLYSG